MIANKLVRKYKKKKNCLEIVCDRRYLESYKTLVDIKDKVNYLGKLFLRALAAKSVWKKKNWEN